MDVIQTTLNGAAYGSTWAPAAAFVSGIVTSIGPCVAPRFIAVIAIAGEARMKDRWLRIGAFIAGLVASSIGTALSLSLLLRLERNSTSIYCVLAVVLAACGLRVLLSANESACEGHAAWRPSSIGGALLLGGSFGMLVSPCCTPIFVALAAVGSAANGAYFCVLLVLSFALGHAMPLLAAACGGQNIRHSFERTYARVPIAVVSGSLMLGIAAYYAVLA
ncbi:MAG: hypothetical protein M3R51_00515 [Candidatus Eremiobacteraeota bacterium]|nr:hypothetical protein [Candidatus Eremiobacteraeota bacterium]